MAEVLLPSVLTFDPKFGNLHLLSVLIGSRVAVVVDWIIQQARAAGQPDLDPGCAGGGTTIWWRQTRYAEDGRWRHTIVPRLFPG